MKGGVLVARGLVAALAVLVLVVIVRPAPSETAGLEGGEALPAGAPAMRFVPVDVVLNCGTKELGAYQVEVTAKGATIVGLEGGESAAFKSAPYYDPAALQAGGRIVVAAFSTAGKLPSGTTRVARLHLAVSDAAKTAGMPEMASRLVVATDGGGQTIDTKVELRAMEGTKP